MEQPFLATPSFIAENGGIDAIPALLEARGYSIVSGPTDDENGCVLWMIEVPE